MSIHSMIFCALVLFLCCVFVFVPLLWQLNRFPCQDGQGCKRPWQLATVDVFSTSRGILAKSWHWLQLMSWHWLQLIAAHERHLLQFLDNGYLSVARWNLSWWRANIEGQMKCHGESCHGESWWITVKTCHGASWWMGRWVFWRVLSTPCRWWDDCSAELYS